MNRTPGRIPWYVALLLIMFWSHVQGQDEWEGEREYPDGYKLAVYDDADGFDDPYGPTYALTPHLPGAPHEGDPAMGWSQWPGWPCYWPCKSGYSHVSDSGPGTPMYAVTQAAYSLCLGVLGIANTGQSASSLDVFLCSISPRHWAG